MTHDEAAERIIKLEGLTFALAVATGKDDHVIKQGISNLRSAFRLGRGRAGPAGPS